LPIIVLSSAGFHKFLLQWNLPQMFVLLTEPYAMIQWSILLQPHRNVVVNFVPGNFSLFPQIPWQWQPLTEPLGSAEPRLKNTGHMQSRYSYCVMNACLQVLQT